MMKELNLAWKIDSHQRLSNESLHSMFCVGNVSPIDVPRNRLVKLKSGGRMPLSNINLLSKLEPLSLHSSFLENHVCHRRIFSVIDKYGYRK